MRRIFLTFLLILTLFKILNISLVSPISLKIENFSNIIYTLFIKLYKLILAIVQIPRGDLKNAVHIGDKEIEYLRIFMYFSILKLVKLNLGCK